MSLIIINTRYLTERETDLIGNLKIRAEERKLEELKDKQVDYYSKLKDHLDGLSEERKEEIKKIFEQYL